MSDKKLARPSLHKIAANAYGGRDSAETVKEMGWLSGTGVSSQTTASAADLPETCTVPVKSAPKTGAASADHGGADHTGKPCALQGCFIGPTGTGNQPRPLEVNFARIFQSA